MFDHMFRPFTKYLDFTGRAQRAEYWFFVLFSAVASIVLAIVDIMMGTMIAPGIGMFSTLFALAIFMPSLALSVRRLHDRDQSGWWVLLAFIPLVGAIVLIIFYCLDGTAGPNRFGPDPKGRG